MKYTVIDNYDKANKLEFENFDDMIDYFEPSKEEFPEFHEEWEQVKDVFDLHELMHKMEEDERFEIVEIPEDVDILMLDRCTRAEAEKHLKNGTVIFEDFEENLESYLDEWDIEEEDREAYRKMVVDKIPVADWGIVEQDGKTYYIDYAL